MVKKIEFSQEEIEYLLDCVSFKADVSRIPFGALGQPKELARIRHQFDVYSAVCAKLKSAHEKSAEKPDDDLMLMWNKVLAVLEKEVLGPIYDSWVRQTAPIEMTDSQLKIGVPSQFQKDWIEERYLDRLKRIVHEVTHTDVDITVVVREQSNDTCCY
jgi:ATPase involved in DNA replication initiation